jgi:prepilin-type processing-associated H-X9-DG protein
VLYCPGLSISVSDIDLWWEFNTDRRIIGYSWLGKRTYGTGSDDILPGLMNGAELFTKTTGHTNSTAAVLYADAVPSEGLNNFVRVPSGVVPYHRAGHMEKEKPAGGNLLFLDGHSAWRPFKQMQQKYDCRDRNVFFWF